MYDLHELIERARAHLAQLGYSVLSMREHEYSWRRLLEWCDREGITGCDHDAESRYLSIDVESLRQIALEVPGCRG